MNNSTIKDHYHMAKIVMYSSVVFGRAALLSFVLFLLLGPFYFIELHLSIWWCLAWDAMLSFLFFIQHSTMIRRSVRAKMTNLIPAHFHSALFSLASSAVLLMLVALWQPSGVMLIELQGPWRWLTNSLFFLAIAAVVWGVRSLGAFDPFGKEAIKEQLLGRQQPAQPFTLKGPYLWVRHPLYFFTLILIWARPDLTGDRLLLNILWSAWIYLGTLLEEKDLLIDFGEAYERYQRQVPMLIPWNGFPIKEPKP